MLLLTILSSQDEKNASAFTLLERRGEEEALVQLSKQLLDQDLQIVSMTESSLIRCVAKRGVGIYTFQYTTRCDMAAQKQAAWVDILKRLHIREDKKKKRGKTREDEEQQQQQDLASVHRLSIAELKGKLIELGVPHAHYFEKQGLVELLQEALKKQKKPQ